MSWLDTFLKRNNPFAEPSTEDKSVELREGSAELDEFVARGELDNGQNLAHGASHLANLLNFDPGNREWMALFDQYFDKTNGDLETLIPRGEALYAATEAMRASPRPLHSSFRSPLPRTQDIFMNGSSAGSSPRVRSKACRKTTCGSFLHSC